MHIGRLSCRDAPLDESTVLLPSESEHLSFAQPGKDQGLERREKQERGREGGERKREREREAWVGVDEEEEEEERERE